MLYWGSQNTPLPLQVCVMTSPRHHWDLVTSAKPGVLDRAYFLTPSSLGELLNSVTSSFYNLLVFFVFVFLYNLSIRALVPFPFSAIQECLSQFFSNSLTGPTTWGYRIHQLHLYKGLRFYQRVSNRTKQSDCETQVMLELWKMQSTPS